MSWLFHVVPYDNETLSSWLIRIAIKHHTFSYALFSHTTYKRGFYKHDLELYNLPTDFVEQLAILGGISIERVLQMTLRGIASNIEEEHRSQFARHSWFITMGQEKKHGYRFCPACLREDAYYRKDWRMLFVNICPEHKVYLLHQCPKCKSPVVPDNFDKEKQIYQCFKCGFDLRKSSKGDMAKDRELLSQLSLQSIADDGYYMMQGKWHYSIGLFEIIRYLVLYQGRHFLKGSNPLLHYGLMYDADPEVMAKLIDTAFWTLGDWPWRFEMFCELYGISNHFRLFGKAEWKRLPFWLTQEVDSIFGICEKER